MKTVVVRYKTRPECADENARLVEKVFAELNEQRPGGFRYVTLRLADGVSFVHILTETDAGGDSLGEQAAFKAFVAAVGERCEEPPVAMEASVVGSYLVDIFGSA
jgi:hypothetical protein